MAATYSVETLGATVTRRQAARILKCAPCTISRLCYAGRLKASQAGIGRKRTHWRISTTDLLEYARLLEAVEAKS